MSRQLDRVMHALDSAGRIEPRIRHAAQITPRALDPVWDGLLWAGKPTLLAGDPGLGKSMLTCDIAARVTTGEPWPCSTVRRGPADVVILSAEDDAEDTIVPRLMAAGADLARVIFVDGITEHTDDGPRDLWLSLDRHLEQLGEVLRAQAGRVRLIIIDPLSAYLGRDTDSHNEGDVRTVLAGLATVATEHRAAVLAVRHLRKSESATAQYRVIGSIAFTAAARAVYVVARDPEDDDARLLLCAKCNLAVEMEGYRYTVRVDDECRPYIGWDDEREQRVLDDIFCAATPRQAAQDERTTAAMHWLRDRLAAGPVPASAMWRDGEAAGYSRRVLTRAKREAGVRAEILGYQGAWHWRLP